MTCGECSFWKRLDYEDRYEAYREAKAGVADAFLDEAFPDEVRQWGVCSYLTGGQPEPARLAWAVSSSGGCGGNVVTRPEFSCAAFSDSRG